MRSSFVIAGAHHHQKSLSQRRPLPSNECQKLFLTPFLGKTTAPPLFAWTVLVQEDELRHRCLSVG